MRHVLLLALSAAGSLALAIPAFAQNVAVRAHPDINLTGFSGAPNALPDAIAAIESASGGKVVAIRYDNVGGAPGYDVVLARGTNVTFERFASPSTGLVVFTSHSEPRWMLKWPARKDVNIVHRARVPLSQAIRKAEVSRKGSGPAVAAGLAVSAANPAVDVHAYNVVLLEPSGAERRVAVDSETGLVIANPQALAPWP